MWLSHAKAVELSPGEVLFRQGDTGDTVFLIDEGAIDVVRDGSDLVLARLGAGTALGVMAVVDGQPRSATLRAATGTRILELPGGLFTGAQEAPAHAAVLANLLREQVGILREGNDRQERLFSQRLAAERDRVKLGIFVTHVIALMCFYGLSMEVGLVLTDRVGYSTFFSVIALLAYMLTLGWMMKRFGDPWSAWGITWHGAGRAARVGILYTLPVLALLSLVKWTAITWVPAWQEEPWFVLDLWHPGRPRGELVVLVLYVLFVPVQEFTARAGLQGTLARFLTGPHRGWQAIALSNLMFATAHIHLGTVLAVLTIGPGLFWGWLMLRQHNLCAPIVSHWMVGLWSFWILGVPGL